tara:strand:+ start:65 stop:829 length:765 start_codon:yes stop_codon:yes gene_type:complete
MVTTAHQKIIRDKKSKELSTDLFGEYWKHINIDIKNAIIKPVTILTAKKIIEEYEWLGCLAAFTKYQYGIFFDNVCGGVVTYSPEYIENLGRWDKYGYSNKILLLSRGACVHWSHKHSASKLISQSIKMLPKKYKVITATVDDLAGEVGTIYQACNFYYVGSMRDSNPKLNSKKGDRDGWLINNKLYGSRALRQKFNTTKIEILKKYYPNIKKVKQNSKGRYFYFRGTKKEKLNLFKAIEHIVKPYPKRTYNDN